MIYINNDITGDWMNYGRMWASMENVLRANEYREYRQYSKPQRPPAALRLGKRITTRARANLWSGMRKRDGKEG